METSLEFVSARLSAEARLSLAMDIGERMLRCGAEIARVEDSLSRICRAFGAERVDVFTITSSIIVTIMSESFGDITQTRRVQNTGSDFHRLSRLNDLSRAICGQGLSDAEIRRRIREIDSGPVYGLAAQSALFALISGAFSLFFGGVWQDALAAAVIGAVLRLLQEGLGLLSLNPFFASVLTAFAGGLGAGYAVRTGLAVHIDKIAIGNVMPLIPGIALTNGIRDMFSGDLISGLLRFAEALLLAAAVALGFVAAARLSSHGF